MCGLFFWTGPEGYSNAANIILSNLQLNARGPDSIGLVKTERFVLAHFLLSVTGNFVHQPIVEDRIYTAFNGEIYNVNELNQKNEVSCFTAIEWNMPDITRSISSLSGEFAAILINENVNQVLLVTDVFATKPLWLGSKMSTNEWGASSYPSILSQMGANHIIQIPPNRVCLLNLEDGLTVSLGSHTYFSLEQHKDSFGDWHNAFERSIQRRASCNYPITIPLSSGYDSGGIAAAMLSLGLSATYYSFKAEENLEVLDARHNLLGSFASYLQLTLPIADKISDILKTKTPDFLYSRYLINADYLMSEDPGAIGLSFICDVASKLGSRVILSGQGADEILSDYYLNGKKLSNSSSRGGIFPNNLSDVYPWFNFYGGANRCYLLKEEYITGCYSMEGRYPFLDKELVQEFFYLTAFLKNSSYKAPLASYLKAKNFPVELNSKKGFNVMCNLI